MLQPMMSRMKKELDPRKAATAQDIFGIVMRLETLEFYEPSVETWLSRAAYLH